MDNNGKKYKKSIVTLLCYIFAVIVLLYTSYSIGSLCAEIKAYYNAYGLSAPLSLYLTYSLQSAQPLIYAGLFFVLGYILDEVRKNNPAYYVSAEDKPEGRAKGSRLLSMTEAMTGVSDTGADGLSGLSAEDRLSVEEEFARSLDEVLKAYSPKPEASAVWAPPEAKAPAAKPEVKAEEKPEAAVKTENKKPRSSSGKKPSGNKQGGGKKPSQSKPKAEGGNDGKKTEGANKSGKSEGGKGGSGNRKGGKKPSQSKPKAEAKAAAEDATVKIAEASGEETVKLFDIAEK